jgi:circadian clock protein KaiB
MAEYILRLYISGSTPSSQRALANLKRLCEQELNAKYEIKVIDVMEHPHLAEEDRVLATPTLIKSLPPPLRRVIGDLSDNEKVLVGLDLKPATNSGNKEK